MKNKKKIDKRVKSLDEEFSSSFNGANLQYKVNSFLLEKIAELQLEIEQIKRDEKK